MTRQEIVPPCPDNGQAVAVPPIEHPLWCRRHDSGALAPPEPDLEHAGRDYVLDTIDFADTLTVTPVQLYELDDRGGQLRQDEQVRLAVVNQDLVDQAAAAHLSLSDVDRLVAMLVRAKRDLELCRG